MSELQDAMNRYGEASVRNYQTAREIGEKVISGFGHYLGDPESVFGVPPEGDWRTSGADYNDAKFSYYGMQLLQLEPIKMGLAVTVPHTKDEGEFCMRLVLTFIIEGGGFSVTVGDGKTVSGLDIDSSEDELMPLYDGIHSYIKETLDSPARAFEAQRSGAIGFLAPFLRPVPAR